MTRRTNTERRPMMRWCGIALALFVIAIGGLAVAPAAYGAPRNATSGVGAVQVGIVVGGSRSPVAVPPRPGDLAATGTDIVPLCAMGLLLIVLGGTVTTAVPKRSDVR